MPPSFPPPLCPALALAPCQLETQGFDGYLGKCLCEIAEAIPSHTCLSVSLYPRASSRGRPHPGFPKRGADLPASVPCEKLTAHNFMQVNK